MRCSRKVREDNRGFTLLELVVTVVILALVTAPFLSSFVTASKTTLKAKRVEESNELGQYIIEQFKGSTVDYMVTTYGLSMGSAQSINDMFGTSMEEFSKSTQKYTVTGKDMSTISPEYAGYKVDITLYPAQVLVNSDDAVPEIDSLDRTKCVVLVDNLTKYDLPTSSSRKIVVNIEYSNTTRKFHVLVDVKTYNGVGAEISGRTTPWDWEFNTLPSVYMLYKPLSTSDVIEVNNTLKPEDYTNYNTGLPAEQQIDPDKDKVNIYLINQKNDVTDSYYQSIGADKVRFREGSATGAYTTLTDLYRRSSSKDDPSILNRTVIYSNLWATTSSISTASARSDKKDTVNEVVKLKKLDTIYNLDVTVYHNDTEVSEFNASKTVSK